MSADPITSPTTWPAPTCYVVAPDRDTYGHRVTHVLICEHDDQDGNPITFETPIGDAGFSAGFWSWACPVGAFHEEQE